jgi:hypothetical protein
MSDSNRSTLQANGWITLLVIIVAAACTEATAPPAAGEIPPGARMEAITSTSLVGIVGSEVAEPPAVRLVDRSGRPLAGVQVTFLAMYLGTSKGGTQPLKTVVTGNDGVALSGGWRLGTPAGAQTLRAFAANLSVEFDAIAAAGPVAHLRAVSGGGQIGIAGHELPAPLVVTARDRFNNTVPGIEIRFTVETGGGELSADPVVTDSSGAATSSSWTLGPAVGVQGARAASGGIAAYFTVEACISLKCRQLLFVRDGDIHVVDLVTGETRPLTMGGRSASPSWSPDGTRIAFVRPEGVYLMNADGTNEILVAGDSGSHWSASWSPTGNALAIGRCGSGCSVLVLDRLDGTTQPRLVAAGGRAPAWSPDGAQIAFVHATGSLEVVTPDGASRTIMRNLEDLEVSGVAWSPDGRAIAFSATVLHGAYEDIYVLEGLRLTQITNSGGTILPATFSTPTWSQSGARLAFSARRLVFDEDMGPIGWAHLIEVADVRCIRVAEASLLPCDASQTLVTNGHSPGWSH